MAEGFQVAGKAIDGIQGSGVVHQPVSQVGNGAGMSDIVALDEVSKQHRAPVFLMSLDAQRRRQRRNFGKAADLQETGKRLLDQQTPAGGKWAVTVNAQEVQIFAERKGEDLPRQCPTAHRWSNFPGQHVRRRAGEIQLAVLRAYRPLYEGFPARNGLDFVEEEVQGPGIASTRSGACRALRGQTLVFRMEGEIRIQHWGGALLLQVT